MSDVGACPRPARAGRALVVRRDAPATGRLDSIQMLRAAAVMIVAGYHATTLFRDPLAARHAIPDPLYFGYAGVDLFFVISGFIIMHVTSRPGLDVREFLLKRVLRILPLYWLVTTLLIAIWALHPAMIPVRGESPWRFFVDSYLLLPTRHRPVLGVGWTLEHEFQFYLLMALLLALGLRRAALPVMLALFVAGVALHVAIDPAARFWDWKLLSLYWIQFALGVIVYRINLDWRIVAPWLPIALGAAGFLVTAALATPLMPADREVPVATLGAFGLIRSVGYGASAFLIVLGALSTDGGEARARGRAARLAIAVGNASFVIYLTHNLVLQGAAVLTRRLPPHALVAALAIIGTLALVMLAGHILHGLVERPIIRFCETVILPRLTGHRASRADVAGR